jgi:hypothetical protein
MGKTPRIVFVNRGQCSRWKLKYYGVDDKSADDGTKQGQFGSATKINPLTADALGIELAIASSDLHGPYLCRYGVVAERTEKGMIHPIVMNFSTPEGAELPFVTQFLRGAFPNAREPIGDDPHKEFRLISEIVSNAVDADPDGTVVWWETADEPTFADEGQTHVYVTRTPGIDHILGHLDRYLKFLSPAKPRFVAEGLGAIWPKAEKGMTRLFTKSRLAYCTAKTSWSTAFDYSFDNKKLKAEEGVFKDMAGVFDDMGMMLAECDDADLLAELIKAIQAGQAWLEAFALGTVEAEDLLKEGRDGKPIAEPSAGCKAWRRAWRKACGDRAVISTGGYADEFAKSVQKYLPIKVASDRFKEFLKLCGIKESSDFMPALTEKDYVPGTLPPGRQAVLNRAIAAYRNEYPEWAHVPVMVIRITNPKAKYAGACIWKEGEEKILIDEQDCLTTEAEIWETLFHEYDHLISKELDGSTGFRDRADKVGGRLMMQKYGVRYDGPLGHPVAPIALPGTVAKALEEIELTLDDLIPIPVPPKK